MDQLENVEYSGNLDGEAFYNLVLAATDDAEQAAKWATERMMARMRRDQKA